MKIRPVSLQLFHEDGQTEVTKLTVPLRTFVNAPKNGRRQTQQYKGCTSHTYKVRNCAQQEAARLSLHA
jgi:hypothetical protein